MASPQVQHQATYRPTEVVVRDIDMPIGSMVMFMVKWAIASIPAFLILVIGGVFLFAALGGFLRGLLH